MRRIGYGVLVALLCGGCFSVETASSPALGASAVEHVYIYNYGWNLFSCLPIVCGNANEESWCPFAFFRNDVRLELVLKKLHARAEQLNCEISNLHLGDDTDVLFDCWYAPVPWVIQYDTVACSAVLVRKGTAR